MMNSMIPNEIKKTLEYCSNSNNICESCILYVAEDEGCTCASKLRLEALAYINQLEFELKNAKYEAIIEFDELLREDCLSYPLEKDDVTMLVDVDDYNNLLKEMVGEK